MNLSQLLRFFVGGLFLLSLSVIGFTAVPGYADQQKAYLYGDFHQPDPVNFPNQAWMRMQHDEVASLEADNTYGWVNPEPVSTETTYSGTWTGQIEFASAPPADYVIIYAFMSWNPDTNKTTPGPWGTITGDGTQTVFNISVAGDLTVSAGNHLALGVNNETEITGYGGQAFDIVTAEDGGTEQPSYVETPDLSETLYLYGDDHEPDPVNFPNQAWMRKQQDEVASLEADNTYGWAAPRPFEEETTLSGIWTGQLKFASAPPAGYVIGYGILSWDPETNDHVTAIAGTITGDGSKKIFDISLTGEITIPAGDHLAFGLNNKVSVTGDGDQAFDIVTFENGGTDQPSFLIMPTGNSGSQQWVFPTGSNVSSTPAIAEDGTIYISSCDWKVYAINPDGTQRWAFDTGAVMTWSSSPAVGADGTVYAGNDDGYLFAIHPDSGTEKWSLFIGGWAATPSIGADGTLYVGSSHGTFHAVSPGGTLKWSFSTSGMGWMPSPAIASDGTLYVGSDNGNFYAVNPDGTEKWSFSPEEWEFLHWPAIDADGTIYTGSTAANLYAINPDGSIKWTFSASGSGAITSSPAIGIDGTVYARTNNGFLHAIDPEDGTEKWLLSCGSLSDEVLSSPAIGADGTIYVGSNIGNLYAVNPNGTEKWSFSTEGRVNCSPVIGDYGTIYIGSDDNNLYAIKGNSGGPADTPWPMFHRDRQHTARSPGHPDEEDNKAMPWIMLLLD